MLLGDYVKSDFVTRALEDHTALKQVRYRRGVGLAHVPQEMRETCMDFLYGVSQRNDKTILIRKFNSVTGEEKTKLIPYVHRWSEPYKNLVLCKLMYAEDYFGVDSDAFLVNLTVPHGVTLSGKFVGYEECMQHVKDAYVKLVRKLRDWGYRTYTWVGEPHENGFAHRHLLVKGKISSVQIASLKLWWSKQFDYSTGTFEHGLTVSVPNETGNKHTSDCSTYHSGSVYSYASYMMKYIGKSLTSSFDEPKYLVFNALLWKTKSRLYGFSRDISGYIKERIEERKEQKYGKKDSSDWVFKSAAICDESGNVVSEISEHRSKPVFEYKDIYVGTISRRFYEIAGSRLDLHAYGRVLKFVGDWVEVYDRVTNLVFGGV